MSQEQLQRTPLYDEHLKAGGKIVPFAGWEMPVQYGAGLVKEHHTVRSGVGIFDVSHMGEVEVKGEDTIPFLEFVTCNAVSAIKDNQAQYTALTNAMGGVIDDIIIYRFNANHFFICVNASNSDVDFKWLSDQGQSFKVEINNLSKNYGQIAVQGPKSFKVLNKIFNEDFGSTIKPFWFKESKFKGSDVIIARTGYTGEDGVEIFIDADNTAALWRQLLDVGAEYEILPCGLGARDSLRLEVCYPLHGHELSPNVTAIESGLGWIVKPEKKGDFIGRQILEKQKTQGAPKSLIGFEVIDAGIVREEVLLFDVAGKEVGATTSGTKTPSVGKSIGMALVLSEVSKVGQELFAEVRGKRLKIKVVARPFYKRL